MCIWTIVCNKEFIIILLILNFTSCIVCLWLSWLKQKLIRARSVCNIERAPYFITIQLQLRPIN